MAVISKNPAASPGETSRSASESTASTKSGWMDLESAALDEEEDLDGEELESEDDGTDETDEDGADLESEVEAADEAEATDEDEGEAEESDEESEAEGEEDNQPTKPKATDKPEGHQGLDDLPVWAKERIQKQSKDIKKLRELANTAATRSEPRVDAPLAHVATAEELREELAMARQVRDHFRSFKDSDFVSDEEGGEPKVTIKEGNQQWVFTKAEVQRKIALAEARLDPDAVDARKEFLRVRDELKPWEKAEEILPGFHEDDSPAQALFQQVVKRSPRIRAEVPDLEILIAHAARSMQQASDTAPTKDFPKGRFKWVKYELDKEGKVVSPKRAVSDGKKPVPGKASKPAGKPGLAPASSKPSLKGREASKPGGLWQRAKGSFVAAESLLDDD